MRFKDAGQQRSPRDQFSHFCKEFFWTFFLVLAIRIDRDNALGSWNKAIWRFEALFKQIQQLCIKAAAGFARRRMNFFVEIWRDPQCGPDVVVLCHVAILIYGFKMMLTSY